MQDQSSKSRLWLEGNHWFGCWFMSKAGKHPKLLRGRCFSCLHGSNSSLLTGRAEGVGSIKIQEKHPFCSHPV